MDNYEIYFLFGSIIGFIVQVVIFIFSLLYYLKSKSIAGLLMGVGSCLSALLFIIRPILTTLIARNMGAMELVNIQGYLTIVGALFACVFTIGFVLAILKMLKTTN
ncbi:hypothetical protein HZY62_11445 [Maribacter polysiphoniae]|uniref:Uncharacterized protein n=1 Tax=Maribacter polysiphoniae TaxID=429344 RepID=A0A316DZK2_9FLAO|nr:hypothetical protein [Maribacter polysiphoniae]MBD1261207.1 hypothetical protein [Maribacter polysiphoniae]PWK23551.1 hypothetical protein LX92_02117 [Maribacter polysiphoniae]